jgi:hypothetical protein
MTPQDAQLIINTAQTAPLQNMQHAAALSEALQRFRTWYEKSTQPEVVQCEPPQFDMPAGEA